MTYLEIQRILREFMRTSPCPRCKTPYKAKYIFIVAFVGMKGLIIVHCKPCRVETIVEVALKREQTLRGNKKHNIAIETVKLNADGNITVNDALDIKNRLKHFHGDMKELFS